MQPGLVSNFHQPVYNQHKTAITVNMGEQGLLKEADTMAEEPTNTEIENLLNHSNGVINKIK